MFAYCILIGTSALSSIDAQWIYVPLILYGASTATTTLACLQYLLTAEELSSSQLNLLLASYVPFCVVPLVMALDMGWRVHKKIASTASVFAAVASSSNGKKENKKRK